MSYPRWLAYCLMRLARLSIAAPGRTSVPFRSVHVMDGRTFQFDQTSNLGARLKGLESDLLGYESQYYTSQSVFFIYVYFFFDI